MRSDEHFDESMRKSSEWTKDPLTQRSGPDVVRYSLPDLQRGKMSLSGKERNHLFLNQGGRAFTNVSAVSGADSIKDGRAVAIWDFDRDGWQDIALVNTNAPTLAIYRNRFAHAVPDDTPRGRMLALRFVGGSTGAEPSGRYACRDGFGATATVRLADRVMTREHRCGEGLAAQNTSHLFFGLGPHDRVESIQVRWPSGAIQELAGATAGELVTVFENASESPDGSGFKRSRYQVSRAETAAADPATGDRDLFPGPGASNAELCMYTSVATWCAACRAHAPHLRHLRNHFDPAGLQMTGVPVEEYEMRERIAKFVDEHQLAYQVERQWNADEIDHFHRILRARIGVDALPATVITDSSGRVLQAFAGIPTVSDVARLLDRED